MKDLIYLLNESGSEKYKIGITNNLKTRLKNIQTGCPEEITVISTFHSPYVTIIEKRLHKKFELNKTNGEWFLLNDSDVFSFINNCSKIHGEIEELIKNGNPYILKRLGKL